MAGPSMTFPSDVFVWEGFIRCFITPTPSLSFRCMVCQMASNDPFFSIQTAMNSIGPVCIDCGAAGLGQLIGGTAHVV